MSSPVFALQRGDTLSAFSFKTATGESFTEQSLAKADLAVLYFFSTQCKPCQEGLLQLQRLAVDNQDDTFVAVAIGKQGMEDIKAFAATAGLSLNLLSGEEPVLTQFNAMHVHPTIYVIGPERQVLEVMQGSDGSIASMLASLAEQHHARAAPQLARQAYERMQAQGGDPALAKAGMGYSLLMEGKAAAAETSFSELSQEKDRQAAARGLEGLAETYLRKDQADKALQVANKAIKLAPTRSMAHLTKAKALYQRGDKKGAQAEIALASATDTVSDFSWQKSEANYAKGNLDRENNKPEIALAAYEQSVAENPYNADALSNQGVTLKESGQPEKAVEVLTELKKRRPKDPLAEPLLRQAKAAASEKNDLERQRYIDGLVKDLVDRFRSKKPQKPAHADDWTSPALAISILGFQSRSDAGLMARAGLESVLEDELIQRLQATNIKVVDRAVLDKVMGELNLGSSDLADPDTALKLGRILAARLIATGSIADGAGKNSGVTLRLIDTETTDIVLPLADQPGGNIDPIAVADKFAQQIAAMVQEKYPLKGRVAQADGENVIINLGKKHSVQPGMVFNVVGAEKPIELNGRILGYQRTKAGELEVTQVEDLMSYAKPRGAPGKLEKNQKVILQGAEPK